MSRQFVINTLKQFAENESRMTLAVGLPKIGALLSGSTPNASRMKVWFTDALPKEVTGYLTKRDNLYIRSILSERMLDHSILDNVVTLDAELLDYVQTIHTINRLYVVIKLVLEINERYELDFKLDVSDIQTSIKTNSFDLVCKQGDKTTKILDSEIMSLVNYMTYMFESAQRENFDLLEAAVNFQF